MGKDFHNNHDFKVGNGKDFNLSAHPNFVEGIFENEKKAKKHLEETKEDIYDLQRALYASDNHSILFIFQAMDAAGKDSTIRHVFSGINPQGFQVTSFKVPSAKEIDHDFLWRCVKALPERGRIGIFNRSYYEEVLVCKVHSGIILNQRLPDVKGVDDIDEDFWKERYTSIRNHERHLTKNGTVIVKFFLNVSPEEQLRRLTDRIDTPRKNWKFNSGDFKERAHWEEYMKVYQTMIRETATEAAPWHVIPADDKPTMRAIVADIVKETLESLSLKYPTLSGEEKEEMLRIRKTL